MKILIFIVLMMVVTTSRAAEFVWNESFTAREQHQVYPNSHHWSKSAAKRELLVWSLTAIGVLPERALMIVNPTFTYGHDSYKIETRYTFRLSKDKVFVGVRVTF